MIVWYFRVHLTRRVYEGKKWLSKPSFPRTKLLLNHECFIRQILTPVNEIRIGFALTSNYTVITQYERAIPQLPLKHQGGN